MDEVRFGLVGTGVIADFHAMAIAELDIARLIAVHDKAPQRGEQFAQKHSVRNEAALDEMLRCDDVDAVIITTPSGSRLEIAVAAAEAGKHVLCEKPMEVTPQRADRIIEACESNGVTLGCVFQSRTVKSVQRIHQALEQGRFGKLILAGAHVHWFRTQEYYDSAQWRGTWRLDGGGALMNQAVHTVDLLCHLAGPPAVASAYVDTLTHRGIEVEDTVVAAVRFANGALGTIEASTCCKPGFPRRLELTGSEGSVVLEDDRLARWQFTEPRAEDEAIRAEGGKGEDVGGGSGDPKAISCEGHRRQILDFARAIVDGTEPMVPGREGRKAVALVCAIYESARTGLPYDFAKGGCA